MTPPGQAETATDYFEVVAWRAGSAGRWQVITAYPVPPPGP